jgi:tetratricopeptide (TPR) repeat protein
VEDGTGDEPSGSPASSPPSMTAAGTWVGTPAYMAPEQHKGAGVDARADQFSFCVAVWRALYGAAPFPGDTAEAIADAIGRGALAEPPAAAAARLPAHVRGVLERGLRASPGARFPTMRELLAALAPAPPPSRARWWAAGAGVVAAGAIAFALIAGRGDDAACPPPDGRIAPVWGAARRDAVRAHVRAVDPAQGDTRFTAAARMVDPFVRDWRAMHVSACEANRVRKVESDALFDTRIRCLGRKLDELSAGVGLVAAAADRQALDQAVAALVGLSPVAACGDAAALAHEVAAPVAPGARAAADELQRRIQVIEVERRASRLIDLPVRARAAVEDARQLGHAPTLTDALAALARVELSVHDSDAATRTLHELTQTAARAHDDRSEAFAWIKLIATTGYDRGKPDEALALVPAASAAILRAGEPVELRTDLLHAEAQVLGEGTRVDEAIAKLGEARRLLEDAGAAADDSPHAPRHADILFETAGALHSARKPVEAIAAYRVAIERYRALFGPDSVEEAMALHNIAESARRAGTIPEGRAAIAEAIRINTERTGESPRLASNLVTMAQIQMEEGDHAGGLATYERSLAMHRKLLGPDDAQLVPVMLGHAIALKQAERYDEAAASYGEVIALVERAKMTTLNLPITYYNRGELRRQVERCPEAIPDYERAAALFVEQKGAKTPYIVYPLVAHGQCLVHLGRPADAFVPLEAALAVEGEGGDALQVAQARVWLGRAKVESRRDRAGGLALVEQGRAQIVAAIGSDGDASAVLAELDRWIAKQR